MRKSPADALRDAEQAAKGKGNGVSPEKRKETVRRVCQLLTSDFIAEEVYDPPKPPQFAVYWFGKDEFETVDSIRSGEVDERGRKIIYKPIFNAHLRKGMVILPRKPTACSIEEVVEEAFSLVQSGFDPCGKEDELKLVTLTALSSWILDREKPLLPIAGIGVFAPIIGIRGPSGSGKNRLANLLRLISYHPFFDVSTHRIPSLYRPLDLWKGTLILDEADVKSTGETSTYIHFLNARATGTPIGRQNPDRPSRCDAFESFGITVVAQRRHFDDNATEGRTIPFYADASTKGLPTLETEEMIQKGLELQDKLLYIRMRYWKDVDINKKQWLEGVTDPRLNSALLPILALARHAPKLMDVVKGSVGAIVRKRRELKSQSEDGVVINTLWEKIESGLWGVHNKLYYVGDVKEKEKQTDGEESEVVVPLSVTKLNDDLKFSTGRIRKIITSLNIEPENKPRKFRLGKRTFRGIFFEPSKMEKRLREFIIDYTDNALYEKLGLRVPVVPDVPAPTSGTEWKLENFNHESPGGSPGSAAAQQLQLDYSRPVLPEEKAGTSGTTGTDQPEKTASKPPEVVPVVQVVPSSSNLVTVEVPEEKSVTSVTSVTEIPPPDAGQKRPLNPEDVSRLARFYPPVEGECDCCGERAVLEFQAEIEEGVPAFLCLGCATWIQKENPDVEWLE